MENIEEKILYFIGELTGEGEGLVDAKHPNKFRTADSDSGMLSWHPTPEIQGLREDGLYRLGTVGDGNCMIHSILTAFSESYRSFDTDSRSLLADKFREYLQEEIDELKDTADILYPEIGGAEGIKDAFENLEDDERTELDMEIGPVIGRFLGFNFLAVQLNDDLSMKPVALTKRSWTPELPTIIINYIGGTTNIGGDAASAEFIGSGHYELVMAPVMAPDMSTEILLKKKKKSSVEIHPTESVWYFSSDAPQLQSVMKLFVGGRYRKRRTIRKSRKSRKSQRASRKAAK
jgi:hypothetical protein